MMPTQIQFEIGGYLVFKLPRYKQEPYVSELNYSVQENSLVKIEKGQVVISGGDLNDIGSLEIYVTATDPNTGVKNNEAQFTLITEGKLILQEPLALKKVYKLRVGDKPLLIDLPKFTNSDNIDYMLTCDNGKFEDSINYKLLDE